MFVVKNCFDLDLRLFASFTILTMRQNSYWLPLLDNYGAGELADGFRTRKRLRKLRPPHRTAVPARARDESLGSRAETERPSHDRTMICAKSLRTQDGSVETADLQGERANRRL